MKYSTYRAKFGANQSFDDTKKSLDDQLKELDSQLDSQLLSKVMNFSAECFHYAGRLIVDNGSF